MEYRSRREGSKGSSSRICCTCIDFPCLHFPQKRQRKKWIMRSDPILAHIRVHTTAKTRSYEINLEGKMRFFSWLFHSLACCQYVWMFNGIFVNENKNSTMYTNPLSSLYVWCQPHTSQPLQQQQQFYLRFSLTHNFPHNFPSNVLLGAHTTKHEKNDSSKHFFAVLKISNFFISSHAARDDDDDDVDCEEKKGSKELKKFTLKLSFYAMLPRCAIKIGESVIN